jgi:hypothetical protein
VPYLGVLTGPALANLGKIVEQFAWNRRVRRSAAQRTRRMVQPNTHNSLCLRRGAINLQIGGEFHDQVGEPLRKLWRKVWSCLPPPLGPALLSQSLQG